MIINKEEYNDYIEESLINLLCYIHRDGGQYISKHGLQKAIDDAREKVCFLLHEGNSCGLWEEENLEKYYEN